MLNKPKLHRKIWKNKKILREAYLDWYKQIAADLSLSNNKTLEIGAGCGNFKGFKPDIVSCDIKPNSWIDMSFDAHKIPFKDQSIANIVLIDTLHHLSNPIAFLHEAGRVLEKKGRLIMVEPFPSPFSLLIYKLFHPEPFIMNINYFNRNLIDKHQENSCDPNQAIPFLLFFKHHNNTKKIFRKIFSTSKAKKISFILYPASGGFENRALLPSFTIPILKLFEYLLTPFRNLIAFRCYILLERR